MNVVNQRNKYRSSQFRGQHKLKVKRASEPEDVLYENLECTKEEVVIGRSFSMFLTFIVLILAMTVNFAIKFEVKELKVRKREERSDELRGRVCCQLHRRF